MKKSLLITFCLVIVISFCACGKNDRAPGIENASDNIVSTTEGVETTPADNPLDVTEPDKGLLSYTYEVPLKDFSIDMPDYHYIEHGFTSFLMDGGRKYVAFTCILDEQIDSVDTAHNRTLEIFETNVTSHDTLQKVNNVTSENVTVNGIDAYRFEGTSDSGHYNAYTYGYSFVYQNTACSLIGVVNDESQLESEKETIKAVVDAMLVSVKDIE